ncbi:MAG: amidohydrolase family protein, partial [Pseudomonas sp.]|nr:amidohydrolase family protein [Pseudomonas sp.]
MIIHNAHLRGRDGLHRITLDGERIAAIDAQHALHPIAEGDLDAAGNLVVPPFVEPHIHLDATLTAGEPAWNMSGTLFEGIERWAERKALVTHEDTKTRAKKTIDMLVDHGIQHVRTHVDVTDPTLAALKAMLEVREETRHLIDLQIVAFPQEGIESYANGRALMEQAIELGADVVGGIPHFENTRDQGVSSIKFLMDLAERTGCLVDVHCDETDDPQSRFLEVLAEEARVRGMGARVTASHTTAMGSYDNAYCS